MDESYIRILNYYKKLKEHNLPRFGEFADSIIKQIDGLLEESDFFSVKDLFAYKLLRSYLIDLKNERKSLYRRYLENFNK